MTDQQHPYQLEPGRLTRATLRKVYQRFVRVKLDPAAQHNIQRANQLVHRIVENNTVVYGVNTGFGRLAQTHIDRQQLTQLQTNLLLSHAVGVGPLLDDNTVRLIMLLKINALARGYSGVRSSVIELLLHLYNAQIYPVIPSKGSVGASGDLAPLAHLSLPLIGEGKLRYQGNIISAAEGLAVIGLKPLVLEAKEGLALLNGTQVSTGLALAGLFSVERNFGAAVVSGALSVDAALGSVAPFDERVQQLRGQPGQIEVAKVYRDLLENSELNRSHHNCEKVQDPYSLRCQPQVMGACLDQINHAAACLVIEANAVSDNPLVFADDGDIICAGNFHAEPVAMSADNLAIAIAEIAALSERRIALLMDAGMSQLPPFLVKEPGINSGFMIAQVTASALVSENKSIAHPASVDSLPTSANQEDHVSMATFAACRLMQMNDNTETVVAIELLAGAQGISLRRPLKTSARLEQVYSTIRNDVAPWDQDRLFHPDIEAVKALIQQETFSEYCLMVFNNIAG
jgi:histidine ammonia-lyase